MCRCVWARPSVLQDCAHPGWLQWRFDNAKALLVLQLRRARRYLEKMASHLAPVIIHNVMGSPKLMWVARY